MLKQTINEHLADERELWTRFADNIGPSDRVIRTSSGYIIVSADHQEAVDGEDIGAVDEWY